MPSQPVQIRYGGQLFNSTTDFWRNTTPCPLVTIDTSAEKDVNGEILLIKNNINLEGFVIGSGLGHSLSGYSGVVSFFTDPNKQYKNFEILCNNAVLLCLSGTSFQSSSADKSENNWVTTLPYSITLESVYNPSGKPLVESYDDSWTIEPIAEIAYFNRQVATPQYNFKTATNADLTKSPSITDLNAISPNDTISNFLQYRITHRLSAVGKTIDRTNTNNPQPGAGITTNNLKSAAYMEAARWVMDRANQAYSAVTNMTAPSGIVVSNITTPSTTGLRLYNHIRTIESSISAGSYGLTDTWLALGTGVKYTEEFTWEVSTDEKFLKTVSLQGTINGLEETTPSGYVIFPSSLMTGMISNNFVPNFPTQTRTNNKYANALDAYVSGVKPFLYHRACQALASVPNATGVPGSRFISPNPGILNMTPLSYTETLNPNAGTVGYNITYSNKPGQWLSGVLTSNISVIDNNQSDLVAEIFVLGRALGPVLNLVGYTKSERRLNLEVTYPVPTGFKESHPNSPDCVIHKNRAEYKQLKDLVDAFKPVGASAFATLVPTSPFPVGISGQVFKTADSTTWNPFEGRFSWDITWVYNTGTCI